MKSCYYVVLHTYVKVDPDIYAMQAGKLLNLVRDVFSNQDALAQITRNAPMEKCHAEVEIAHSDDGIVGKCVLDIDAPTRIHVDKPKMSALLKANGDWPNMKIEKRAVINNIADSPVD